MPDLLHTLSENDLGFYKIVAEAWGVQLNAPDAQSALKQLVKALLQPQLMQEMVDALPPEHFAALEALVEAGGRLPWAVFCRRFGELRPAGAGRRDRERPDLNPASPTEFLWYRALIGKAFLNTPPEPQEYAYIPSEFLDYLQPFTDAQPHPLGRMAEAVECRHQRPAADRILDDSCTLLAGLRLELPLDEIRVKQGGLDNNLLLALLKTSGMVDSFNLPVPDTTRAFLEAPRANALLMLTHAWLESQTVNDLLYLPGLVFESQINNHPLETRQKVLGWLTQLPAGEWWHLPSFISAIKESEPDFQRPAGDYDSWFIRLANTANYLRGFSAWDDVDGAFIRFLLVVILPALGLVELAAPDEHSQPAAFRLSRWAKSLLENHPPTGLPSETQPIKIAASGHISIPQLAPRSARYQISRFCAWLEEQPDSHHYALTPAALERARQQGLKVSHLVSLLRRYSAAPIPPLLLQALERWEKFGPQAQLEQVILLRVTSPEVIETLRKSRASRHLGEALSPTVILIHPRGETAVLQALAEAGYLADAKLEV